jgi:hypothetical protein
MTAATPSPQARRVGAPLMWFAVLGGAIAWSAHALSAWSINELACAAGGRHVVAGVSLTAALAVTVVVPGAAALAALLASWIAWRRTSAAAAHRDGAGIGRAAMLALLGFGANLLFVAIIAAGGAALLVFPPCQR